MPKPVALGRSRRGVVDPRCNLPGRVVPGQMPPRTVSLKAGAWCHSDYGHAQIDVTAPSCGDSPVYIVRQMQSRVLVARPARCYPRLATKKSAFSGIRCKFFLGDFGANPHLRHRYTSPGCFTKQYWKAVNADRYRANSG